MKYVLTLALFLAPLSVHAERPSTATAEQLDKAVESMRMPRLEARLKARAAAYRLFHKTVMRLGFGHDLVQHRTLDGKEFASAKRTIR